MSKVYWDNGEEITDDALLSFFTGSTTYDLMKEELCQLKHEMTQDTPTVPLADAGANDMLREELSQLQQPQVSQENINFVGAYINLNKTSDAVVDLTEDPLEKGKLITQPPSGDDEEQNLVEGEGKVADTLLPYKLPFSATRLSRSFVQVKMDTAVKKRE